MLAAGNIRVGEFVYQHDGGMTREDGINVHFVKKCAFVLDLLAGNGLHLLGKLFDAFASMSFDETDGYILAAAMSPKRFTQHTESFADARRIAEKKLKNSACFFRRRGDFQPFFGLFRQGYLRTNLFTWARM